MQVGGDGGRHVPGAGGREIRSSTAGEEIRAGRHLSSNSRGSDVVLYSGLYVALDGVERLHTYRLHPKVEEAAKNVVSRPTVVRGILVPQVVVALTLFAVIPPRRRLSQNPAPPLVTASLQIGRTT